MCMCEHANINGQPGYCWNDRRHIGIRPVDPPPLSEGDTLLYDEPGRCCKGTDSGSGTDSHSHHFRLVRSDHRDLCILVQHGGGVERIEIPSHRAGIAQLLESLAAKDTHGRYWMMHLLYYIHRDAATYARNAEKAHWAHAAAEKRIKVRRRGGRANVSIEPRTPETKPVCFSL